MIKGPFNSVACLCAIVATVGLTTPINQATARVATHTFETEVKELRASNVNGQNRLLLEIAAVTGPTGCKSSSVLLSAEHHNESTQADIEAVALKAFVNSESVVISVPTASGHCIDGKPLVSDLRLLNTAISF